VVFFKRETTEEIIKKKVKSEGKEGKDTQVIQKGKQKSATAATQGSRSEWASLVQLHPHGIRTFLPPH